MNDLTNSIIILDGSPLSSAKPGAKVVNGKNSNLSNPESTNAPSINPIVPEFEDLDGEHIFVKDCDASKFYGDTDDKGAFLKDNLFSELTTEYQRLIARKNLGIDSKNSLTWGNLTGNLLNQKDLVKFVSEYSINDVNNLIEEVNQKLAQWGFEIENDLKLKADVDSPALVGKPTTTVPEYSDNSNRIPTTSWVKYLIDINLEETNLDLFTITPDNKLIGLKVPILLKWIYLNPVEKQWINDKELDPNTRSLNINSLDQSELFTLKWVYEGKTYSKSVWFKVIEPFYAGISPRYDKCVLYTTHRLTVNAGDSDFIYIYLPTNLDLSIMVNGLGGGFSLIGYIYISDIKYSVYRSDNTNLGLTHIDIIDNQLHYERNNKQLVG